MYTEMAYVLGIVILALGTALMEKADFGMSMVVAPAYLVYLKVSQTLTWFTFGMAEYCFQALLLVTLALVLRRFHRMYLFSFVTAVIYGVTLDLVMAATSWLPTEGMGNRVWLFLLGMVLCSKGVSLLFHTYIAPEAYELFVKEVAARYGYDIHKTKTVYDCCSCLMAIAISFAFFGLGHFEGVKAGTIVCALVNGYIIGCFSKVFEKKLEFVDGTGLRKYFE